MRILNTCRFEPLKYAVRLGATVLLIALALFQLAPIADAAPQLQIVGAQRIQPGWIRIYLSATDVPKNAHYQLAVTCSAPTDVNSITTSTGAGNRLSIDVKVNLAWLTENNLPAPCRMTNLSAQMISSGNVVAQISQAVDLALDLPLSHMTPSNMPVTPTGSSVSLTSPSIYAAYPPTIVAVKSATGRMGFVEIEELPLRGTLGLRGLSSFIGSFLEFELGGGGEIQTGWGLDINSQGIWRAPELQVEIQNPGHDVFPYTGTTEPPLLSNNPSLDIFPAPPLFSESTYETFVLDNRGAKRCYLGTGCMDFTYDSATHTLIAINGAKISAVAPAPLTVGAAEMKMHAKVQLAPVPKVNPKVRAKGELIKSIDPAVSRRLLETAKKLSASGRDLTKVASMPTALSASSAPTRSKSITRDRSHIVESPQELMIDRLQVKSVGPVVAFFPKAQCVINGTQDGVTSTPSACAGMNNLGFACPTSSDPIKVEAITTRTGSVAALNGTIPPYYAGRDNYYGTCGSHAATQYVEALLDKYSDDLAVKRVVFVDGAAVVVPEPRVAFTVSGGLTQLYTWDGTHAGDPPSDPWPPAGTPAFPNFIEAYWPAREGDFATWATNTVQGVRTNCQSAGFWSSGFCIGQGHPGPGIYYAHSVMTKTLHSNPLSDPPWSLGDSYFNFVSHDISLDDRDAAMMAVINEISGNGLPVNLSFPSAPTKNTPDGSGGSLTYFSGMTWYLPPELGTCDRAALDAVFAPGRGHNVNIVGYWVSGSMSSPDPFSSYFIIENNWGKGAGYHSFFFMNFAAFKYLASGLTKIRLDRTCWSAACDQHPRIIIPPNMVNQFLFPLNLGDPMEPIYEEVINEARAQLGGVMRITGGVTNRALTGIHPLPVIQAASE